MFLRQFSVIEVETVPASHLNPVIGLWESTPFDPRGHGPGSKKEVQRREAERVLEKERAKLHARRAAAVGLSADAPDWAVADLEEELGIYPRRARRKGTSRRADAKRRRPA
jgi:hypothetical protein